MKFGIIQLKTPYHIVFRLHFYKTSMSLDLLTNLLMSLLVLKENHNKIDPT